MTTILVIGGTGNVGIEVVKQLAQKKNVKVLVATRDPNGKQTESEKSAQHVQFVKVDIFKPESVESAMKGVDKLILIPPGGVDTHATAKPIIDAAHRSGIKHIVYLSAAYIDLPEKRYVLGTRHLLNEQYIRSLGIKITALRSTSFYTNVLTHFSPTIKAHSTIYGMVREDQKFNWVSNEDIAAVAVASLTEPAHEDKIYTIGGDHLTMVEAAKVLSKYLGREIKYVNFGEEGQRKALTQFGAPAEFIDGIVDLWKFLNNGGYDFPEAAETVKRVTGKAHQSLEQWLETHGSSLKHN